MEMNWYRVIASVL